MKLVPITIFYLCDFCLEKKNGGQIALTTIFILILDIFDTIFDTKLLSLPIQKLYMGIVYLELF